VGMTSGQFARGSNRLSLGSPEFASFVQFDGTDFRTVTGNLFNLGNLTYQNGVTELGSEPQGDVPLAIAASFDRPVNNAQTFTFDFNNTVVPNETGDPVIDGDRLRFSSSGLSSERIEALDTEYTLDLFGFSTDGSSVIGQFNSPENSTANANLFGKITVAESRIIPPFLWEKIKSNVARVGIGLAEGFTTSIRALNPFSNPRTNKSSGENSTPEEVFKITEEIATQFPGGVLGSNERDVAIGSSIEDFVFGDGGADLLAGSVGDDIILGVDGDDELYGGKNDDFLNGNRGNDLVSGDLGDDFLRGGRDNDTLLGGDGDDVLVGDKGIDLLTGGLGADVFILRTDTGEVTSEPSAADRILDFNAAEGDRIGITDGVPIEVLSFAPADIDGNGIEDTIIQYIETNEVFGTFVDIFGVALDVAPDVARSATFSVPIEEPLLLT
ncbi:MAG: choice-of-anchor K domain-containing protein, partial [Cyanobacteriota bacterium]|nr:choice-of-anchor K domain-containing protein [Cyanobacteriota bacterium]